VFYNPVLPPQPLPPLFIFFKFTINLRKRSWKSRNIHYNQHLIKVNNNNIKQKNIIKDLQRIINEEEERPINLMGF